MLARHSTTPGAKHIDQLMRVVKYLNATSDMGITYRRKDLCYDGQIVSAYQSGVHPLDPDKVQPMRAYADADFMGGYTRKSTSGWMIMFAGSCWIYSSKLQTLCSMSTAESEVNSAVECSKSIVHAKLLLKELGFLHQYSQPVTVHEDNSSVVAFSENLKSRKTTRHYELRVHYLQELVQNQVVTFQQVETKLQLADILTKSLPRDQHQFLRAQMLGDVEHAALTKVPVTAGQQGGGETSLNSEERSLPIEPASEIPPGEVGSSIAAQVAVIIQTNKVRMPTAAIVMQQADVMENQYQVPRYRSTCNYGFSDLRYEYMT